MAKKLCVWLLIIAIVFTLPCVVICNIDVSSGSHVFVSRNSDDREAEVMTALSNGSRIVVMQDSNAAELDCMLDKVYDDPDLFWVDMTYNAFSLGNYSVFAIREKYDNIQQTQALIDQSVNEIIKSVIRDNMSEYEKVLAIHDWICNNVTYGSGVNNSDQDIYGAIVLKRAMCAGYAESFAYILNRLDIKSEVISGESINKDGESVTHAWNLVYIDGEPYYFDVTWDDDDSGIIYDWFGVTSEEFKHSHFPSSGYEWVEATSLDANYYARNGMYLDSYNSAYLVQQINRQGKEFTIKCSDWLVMSKVIKAFGDRAEVQKIMKGANIQHIDQIVYVENERVCCLHVTIK